jgi:hypothetical protein
MPVSIRIFGITLSFLIPGGRIATFFIGVLFWAVMGPLIKYVTKEIIKNLGAILGGHYVEKDVNTRYERGKAFSEYSHY